MSREESHTRLGRPLVFVYGLLAAAALAYPGALTPEDDASEWTLGTPTHLASEMTCSLFRQVAIDRVAALSSRDLMIGGTGTATKSFLGVRSSAAAPLASARLSLLPGESVYLSDGTARAILEVSYGDAAPSDRVSFQHNLLDLKDRGLLGDMHVIVNTVLNVKGRQVLATAAVPDTTREPFNLFRAAAMRVPADGTSRGSLVSVACAVTRVTQ